MKTLGKVYNFLKEYSISSNVSLSFSFMHNDKRYAQSVYLEIEDYHTPIADLIKKYKDREVIDVDVSLDDGLEIDIAPTEEEIKILKG